MASLRDIRVTLYTAVAAILVLIGFLTLTHRPSIQSLHHPLPSHASNTFTHHPAPSAVTAPIPTKSNHPEETEPGKEKLAYVTWLSSTVVGENSENLDEDKYFIGTRILVWQLLHYSKTKTDGIDVVVVVTPDVSESRRERLRKDGAIVRPIDFVHGKNDKWLHPKEDRWNDIMSKLRVWEMEEYSRILMLDGDMILQHPLDGIFEDPASKIATRLRNASNPEDEPDIPDEYLLASIGEVAGADHAFPPDWDHGLKKFGYFCAGFFMLKPNKKIFNYYTALLDIENRFDPKYMEQNLLNYAHRWDGPMPWKELAYTWNIRSVNDNDLDKGVASMHEKWWENPLSDSERVRGIFQSVRWQMEGYYLAQDELHK
ncbi:nucleotide-diphospho-sugar transferase [Lindgomyces ingoldianus]|uniref:Nucleotide-diphospho-sugar transferase n=1 Tax=Lindgomyces ingoldianus TaxID=673940 RepID=A0ACB6R4P5_9PLEO|nr:nucleotide-diphospho-sugar transferase [Lindgomyces ingoldianus]KAF2474224.1 nucleotide-diphospho-sugar transferase [Lindgomyces ingoldianus]